MIRPGTGTVGKDVLCEASEQQLHNSQMSLFSQSRTSKHAEADGKKKSGAHFAIHNPGQLLWGEKVFFLSIRKTTILLLHNISKCFLPGVWFPTRSAERELWTHRVLG